MFTSPTDLPKAPTEVLLQPKPEDVADLGLQLTQAPRLKINVQERLSKSARESKRKKEKEGKKEEMKEKR